jgi:hypothetical protein
LDTLPERKQTSGAGNYNSRAEFSTLFSSLPRGWDTLLSDLRQLG